MSRSFWASARTIRVLVLGISAACLAYSAVGIEEFRRTAADLQQVALSHVPPGFSSDFGFSVVVNERSVSIVLAGLIGIAGMAGLAIEAVARRLRQRQRTT